MYLLSDDQLDRIIDLGQKRLLFGHTPAEIKDGHYQPCRACWAALKELIREVAMTRPQMLRNYQPGEAKYDGSLQSADLVDKEIRSDAPALPETSPK